MSQLNNDENSDIGNLRRETEKLKVENEIHKINLIEKEKQINRIALEAQLNKEKLTNSIISESRLAEQVHTWEKIVDEIAHSINTDVFIAVNSLSKFLDNPKIKKAYHHTNQIREITNLLMWYIKRNELELSGEMAELNPAQIINEQIDLVKEGISTLRISSDDHHDNLTKMEVTKIESDVIILVTKEIKESIPLILKDFVRNAYKNTDEDDPRVSYSIESDEENVILKITNNRVVSREYADWFNGVSANEPETISKSFKVGLRVIKIWVNLLDIKAELIPGHETGTTTAVIKLPRVIKYEKN